MDVNEIQGFESVDPSRQHRLQKELEYKALDAKKFESDGDFEKWKTVVSRRHMINAKGYMGLDAIGTELLEEAEKQYRLIRAKREATRIKAEKEEALSEVINRWLAEKTPLTLILSGENPELIEGVVLMKFSDFKTPSPYILLARTGFRRKIAVSSKWAVVQEDETLSCGDYQLTARAADGDQIEALFGLPAADLLFAEAK
jgi:hypothetical protein